MSKDELYNQIQRTKSQISEANEEKAALEEKWDVLLEFIGKCNDKAEKFLESIQRRKDKLSGIEDLLSRMKAALSYQRKMNDLLTGRDYSDAKGSIDSLMEKLDSQKRQLKCELEKVEDNINYLKSHLQQLQYEYDTYPEEAENDG